MLTGPEVAREVVAMRRAEAAEAARGTAVRLARRERRLAERKRRVEEFLAGN